MCQSTCKRKRRQARIDPRYRGQKFGDAGKRYAKMQAKVTAERLRAIRKK